MSSFVRTSRTLAIAAALAQYILVREDANGKWAACGLGEAPEAINSVTSNAGMATDGFQAACELLAPGRTAFLTASAAITKGQPVYPAAAGQISMLVNGTKVGIARQAATAQGDVIEVELQPDLGMWVSKIVGPSSDIAGTAAETAYDKTVTIGAGVLKVGTRGRITAKVIASATTGSETLLLKLKITDGTNTVILAATPAVDVADGNQGVIHADFEILDATHIQASGFAGIGTATGAGEPTGVASSTFAPTVAATVSVTQTASSTGETSALQMLAVEIHR